ncbi:MAG: VTT domain-containing protein [Chloroflexi bacterium]|nr:VTT domain-containing protein [Chloroflexota bacterium]
MPRKETVIGVLALLLSIALVVFALLYRDYLFGIANIASLSLLGIFTISLISASVISVTMIPIPYYLPVFVLSSTLSLEWGLLAPVFVGLTSAGGASLGQVPTFLMGYGGKQISQRLAAMTKKRPYLKALEWVKRRGSVAVFLISAVPNPVHLPLTVALGALQFPPAKWALLTFLGNLTKCLAFAFIGYYTLNNVM